jgi:hypothetical protein
MRSADVQQQRLLERLRQAGDQPVAFAELHSGGITFPAAVVAELELNGYVIDRVYDHGLFVGGACSIQNPASRATSPPHTGGADDGHGVSGSHRRTRRDHWTPTGLWPSPWTGYPGGRSAPCIAEQQLRHALDS